MCHGYGNEISKKICDPKYRYHEMRGRIGNNISADDVHN
jgi:hypothetical protein